MARSVSDILKVGVIYRFAERHPWLGFFVAVFMATLWRPLWHRRGALVPVWFALCMWLIGVMCHVKAQPYWGLWWLVAFVGILVGITGPYLGSGLSRALSALVPNLFDAGKLGALDSWVERFYIIGSSVYIALWEGDYTKNGGGIVLFWTMMIGLATFGGLYTARRYSNVGRGDRIRRKWWKLADPEQSELRELHRSRVISAQGNRNMAKLCVELDSTKIFADVSDIANNVASFYNMRSGSVFISPDRNFARRVWFTFLPRDPWKGKIPHPSPQPGSITLAGMDGTFPMGMYANGTVAHYKLAHTLLAGASGSGKTIWLESLLIWLTSCRDVVVVGADLASGASLGVWRKLFPTPLAEDVDATTDLLRRVLKVVEYREKVLGVNKEEDDEAEDSFVASEEEPWLVVVIDEFPDWVAEAGDVGISVLGRIAKRARKCGIRLVLAAQNASKADLGSKEVQAQLKCTVGLGLSEHASRVLWGANSGWSSSGLENGQYVQRDDEHQTQELAKGWFVSVSERRAHVVQAEKLHTRLEPAAHALLTRPHDAIPTDGDLWLGDPMLNSVGVPLGKQRRALKIFGFNDGGKK